MYIRFGAGILLVVAISVTGVAIEKEILSTKRELSHQAYREEVLLERYQRARTRVEEFTAPGRMSDRRSADTRSREDRIEGQASDDRSTSSHLRTAQGDRAARIR